MGLKIPINWPVLISSFSQIISFTLHPFLTHFLFTHTTFTFPATTALIQLSTTAICLWFWSVFGLYRVRKIPITSLLPLSASSAALALLALFTLATSSLLIFQTSRLLSACIVLSVRTKSPLLLFIAIIAAVPLILPFDRSLIIPLCYTLFASTNALIIHPIASKTNATELQLHVLQRTLSSILLLPPAIFLDYTNPMSSIRHLAFDDPPTILVFATGIIAFFSFITSRATINRLSPVMHDFLLLAANLAVFACHFLTTEERFRYWHVAGLVALPTVWAFLAERRRDLIHADDDSEVV